MLRSILVLVLAVLPTLSHAAEPIVVVGELLHLRNTEPREWSTFPESAQRQSLEVRFVAAKNETEWTLRLRQENVKEAWELTLNDRRIDLLRRDENSMVVCLSIPPGACADGENVLRISSKSTKPDDVRVGEIHIHPQPRADFLNQGQVSVRVVDRAAKTPLPCRLTILDEFGAQHDVGAVTDETHAVRGGVIYCADGTASLGLPSGSFQLVAGRGFEYGIATREIRVTTGQRQEITLELERQVDTAGWISCDTHVHTLTHSGHGDATLVERMITLAGEHIELPVATDHNKQIDFRPQQRAMGLERWFTPVVGNEVTTAKGHFNIFPAPADGPVPDHRGEAWTAIFESIRETANPEIIILNHARDLHSNYRPFGPRRRHPLTGRQLDGWELEANAMEVFNSSAQQSDILQLPRDWMVSLNRGQFLTPVGSSDSHDVARHFVGQGRTYIRCDDRDPGNIDVAAAVKSFRERRVIVSCGLMPVLTVNGRYGPGDIVPRSSNNRVRLDLEVRAPDWIEATQRRVYLNGELIPLGESSDIEIDVPEHDCFLVFCALGPGVESLHWPTARPYQPVSEVWEPHVFGMTGAIWYDGNGDGRRNSAQEIAVSLFAESGEDPARFIALLGKAHRSVVLQGAELLHLRGIDLNAPEMRQRALDAGEYIRDAFDDYLTAWRECEIARASGKE